MLFSRGFLARKRSIHLGMGTILSYGESVHLGQLDQCALVCLFYLLFTDPDSDKPNNFSGSNIQLAWASRLEMSLLLVKRRRPPTSSHSLRTSWTSSPSRTSRST